jgi:peptidyl-prolyl cis-trans isomerase B (cyclophilin B)
MEFLPEVAPTHTLVFQNLIRTGFFDRTVFHRILPKRAIQGGGPNSKDDYPYDDGFVLPTQRRIMAEISPKARHTRGAVSAAHADDDMDSATSQFFISTGTDPAWDGKYTIFARVIQGMDVVDAIAAAPLRTDDMQLKERPVDPVRITKAYLAPRETALSKR